jgi:O-antigen ligase
MEPNRVDVNGTRAGFKALPLKSGSRRAVAPARPLGPLGTYLAAPTRVLDSMTSSVRAGNRAFVVLIVTAMALVIIPEVINYLILKHVPDQSIEQALVSAESPIAGLARWALSGALLAVASVIVLMRGHPNRDVTALLILMLALNLPYVIGPEPPGPADLIKIVLANIVLLAIWNTGAPIAELKWIPILVSVVGAYSLIGGLLIPEYMMYNYPSRKAIIGGWQLAGPFGQSNALGMYCGVAFFLIPLIAGNRWRVLCGAILLTTIVASATRTALTAVGVVMLWWLLCWLRSWISIRLAGSILASLTLATAMIVPFLNWSPDAFTGRAFIWAQGLRLWEHSPIVGMGFNWFLVYGQSAAELVVWAAPGTGHNILVDTLIKSGLAGMAALLPVWIGAIFAVRRMPITYLQVAFFGYLIGFFVMATTEAVWELWPNIQQFPTSGLIFATLLMSRSGVFGRQSSDVMVSVDTAKGV